MFTFSEAEQRLQRIFGFPSFYKLLRRVIDQILLGKRVLLIEITGFGKSLCYPFPASQLDGVTMVF